MKQITTRLAIEARNRMLQAWSQDKFQTPRYKLYAKCAGIVHADRIEMAVISQDWKRCHELN